MKLVDTYMEVVTLTLELGGGVDFVSHDPGDSLLDVLHPFNHLGLTHDVDLLDEGVILLPESHLGRSGGAKLERKSYINGIVN